MNHNTPPPQDPPDQEPLPANVPAATVEDANLRSPQRRQPPATFITTGVDLIGNRIDFDQTFRFHDTIAGATTNLTGYRAELDNTMPLLESRHGHPSSPRVVPKDAEDRSRTEFSYTPRRAEEAVLSLRGLVRRIRGKPEPHHSVAAPTHEQPRFVNYERFSDQFQVDNLRILDKEISDETSRLIVARRERGTLSTDEEEQLRAWVHQDKLREYAGHHAHPELIRQIDLQRGLVKARDAYEAALRAPSNERSQASDPVLDKAVADAIRDDVREWRRLNGYPDDARQDPEVFEQTKVKAKARVIGERS